MPIKVNTIKEVSYKYIIDDVRELNRAELIAMATIDLLNEDNILKDKKELLKRLTVKPWKIHTNQSDESIILESLDDENYYMYVYIEHNKIAIEYNTSTAPHALTTFWTYEEYEGLIV